MCRVLEISRSGYYAWSSRPSDSPRQQSDRELLKQIRSIHKGSRGTYGSPRIHAALHALEQRVGRKRVARLMRQDGLAGKVRRRFVVTTDSSHGLPVAPNILDRDFNPAVPDQVWAGDIDLLPRTRPTDNERIHIMEALSWPANRSSPRSRSLTP